MKTGRFLPIILIGLATPVVAETSPPVRSAITLLQYGRETGQPDLMIGGFRALQLARRDRPGLSLQEQNGGVIRAGEAMSELIAEARFLARGDAALLQRLEGMDPAGAGGAIPIDIDAASERYFVVPAGEGLPDQLGILAFGAGAASLAVLSAAGQVLCQSGGGTKRDATCPLGVDDPAVTDGSGPVIRVSNGADRKRTVWLYVP
ncbi:MAG: hypothetical protein KDE08_09270 [Rhodobacteraceae bacterium]|nr:hypothetical protein [Paracoccaceae bacterium]